MSPSPLVEPLFFRRLLKETVWGGHRLAPWLGETPFFDGPVGESWELSDVTGQESVVMGGAHDGKTLHALLETHRENLMGLASLSADGRFPLLVKFLEAEKDLSVQVHPADDSAPNGQGKTECWYFLDAEPKAEVICGLKKGTLREEFSAVASESEIETFLTRQPISSGDFLFVPAGQVHAIRPGVLLCEIQQTSDITYRLYDWGRVGLNGEMRETHIAQALEVIDFHSSPSVPIQPVLSAGALPEGWTSAPLADDKHFRISLWSGEYGANFSTDARPRIHIVIAGQAQLQSHGVDRAVKPGDTFLIPAASQGYSLQPLESCTLLEAVPA
ncbi:MAG: class I mannose-6-phosphate isomerase [Planctomycetota bacterium]|nr:class I mannose-6-phosphate isomerase [Planctomycetota bacterium]